jgi:hypothetical protein
MSASTRTGQRSKGQTAAANGRQQSAESVNADQRLSGILQRQISEALEPVVSGLRDQMVETVREQLEENLDPKELRALQRRQPPGTQREGRQADTEEPEDEGTSPSLPRRMYEWLSNMIRTALTAIKDRLSSLVDQVRSYVISAIGTTLMAMLRPILKAAIQKALDSMQQQGMDKLLSFGQSSSK